MYSVYAYGRMIADEVRTSAYAEALGRSVHPGAVVVDVGAGTGAFSLLACKLGAKHVYAIETSPALAIAKESASDNGFTDRITFFDRVSTAVVLPEPADVLVSDLRGSLPLYEQHIVSIVDARQRFLRPGGTQIPMADELWVALVYDEAASAELTDPWSAFGLDMRAARRFVVNVLQGRRVEPEAVVGEPRCWAEVDYRSVVHPSVAGEASWQIEQPTKANGLCLWFTAHLMDGLSYSTSPFDRPTVYGTTFAPLAEELTLKPGDHLRVRLRADLVGDSYTWTWNTDVVGDGTTRALRQSSFLASPAPLVPLSDRAEKMRPEVGARADAASVALGLLNGHHTIGEVADRLCEQFPNIFRMRPVALRFVANLAEQYTAWA